MTWVLGREFSYLGGDAELNKFRSADQPMRTGVQCQLSPAADMPSIRPCADDDEVTHRRNTKSFESCDLVPSVLSGVENVDLSVTQA